MPDRSARKHPNPMVRMNSDRRHYLLSLFEHSVNLTLASRSVGCGYSSAETSDSQQQELSVENNWSDLGLRLKKVLAALF